MPHNIRLWRALLLGIILTSAVSRTAAAQEGRTFVAHVATTQKQDDALADAERLKRVLRQGLELFIHEVPLPAQGASYRLRIGPLMTAEEAASVCRDVLASGHAYCRPEDVFQLAGVRPGFYGELLLRPLPDGRNMQVAQSFGFVDNQARKWEVPVGTVTDGASIPKVFWSIIGSPFSGRYRLAAVIHDHFCGTKHRSWKDTHDNFYETMIASGEDKQKALLMWAAVYRFGPRWLQSESGCWGTCAGDDVYVETLEIQPTYSEKEFAKIKAAVGKRDDLTLEELRAFVDEHTYEFAEARVRGIISGGGDGDKDGWPRKQVDGPAPNNWMSLGGNKVTDPVYRVFNVKQHDFLNMRSASGATSPVVGKIPHDASGVVILERGCASTWCRVRYRNTEGWVNTSFLIIDLAAPPPPVPPREKRVETSSPPATKETTQPKVVVANDSGSPYKIYAQPNKQSRVVGTIPGDATTIEPISACSIPREWCQLRYGKIEGWVVGFVYSRVIGRARNISPSDLKVLIEPNDIGSTLGVIPKGATGIAVTDNCQPDWCTIRLGKVSGWSKRPALEIEWSGTPYTSHTRWKSFENAIDDNITGSDFLKRCASSELAERCTARIFFESMRMTLLDHPKQRTLCPSPVSDQKDAQALARVSKWLQSQVTYHNRPASEGIVAAIRAEFPCR